MNVNTIGILDRLSTIINCYYLTEYRSKRPWAWRANQIDAVGTLTKYINDLCQTRQRQMREGTFRKPHQQDMICPSIFSLTQVNFFLFEPFIWNDQRFRSVIRVFYYFFYCWDFGILMDFFQLIFINPWKPEILYVHGILGNKSRWIQRCDRCVAVSKASLMVFSRDIVAYHNQQNVHSFDGAFVDEAYSLCNLANAVFGWAFIDITFGLAYLSGIYGPFKFEQRFWLKPKYIILALAFLFGMRCSFVFAGNLQRVLP